MNSLPLRLSLSCGTVNLCFIVGPFNMVMDELWNNKSPRGQVVLPCTLYDLARVDNDPTIASTYQKVDFLTTDGMPLVWWFRGKVKQQVERVYGPDILAATLDRYPNAKYTILCPNLTVYEELAKKFHQKIKQKTAQLILVGDSTDPEERKRLGKLIKGFVPKFVWIGIGSPNQVLLGTYLRDTLKMPITYWCVGAAIPFLAGTVNQAPRWMQRNGLEWLFRLINEPRRLWQRYLVITPLFLLRIFFTQVRNTKA
ncbi:WecB/TagA/CpsF family glycosyltransferase [Patescibacteria group bacterium]|nr:WecB/TagA/CpsF family glycosyltransferase [Patescibacteria group bacterium]